MREGNGWTQTIAVLVIMVIATAVILYGLWYVTRAR
jgi:hypothetical protein